MLSTKDKVISALAGIGVVVFKEVIKVNFKLDEFTSFELAVGFTFLGFIIYLGFKKLYEYF